jgi:hypothetical protein
MTTTGTKTANRPAATSTARRPEAIEPQLSEVLADPIVRAVMARDGVKEQDLSALVESLRRAAA